MQESMPAVNEVRSPGSSDAAISASKAGDATEDFPRNLANPRVLQILMTEHWSLIASRSLVYNETFARAGMFFTTLSASVVALALILAAIGPGPELQVIAVLLLVFDVVIGLVTVGRVNDASVEDWRCIQGMNRLRHAYHEVAPMINPYLSTSRYDDLSGVLYTYASGDVIRSPIQGLLHAFTTASAMVTVVTNLLVAVLAGLLVSAAGAGMAAAVVFGAIAFIAAFAVSLVLVGRTFERMETEMQPRFPSAPADQGG